MGKFTTLEVEKLRGEPGRYCDGGGLWLFVSSGSSASWIFRFSIDGVQRDMGLGGLRNVPLKQARKLAEQARALRAEGKDPKAEREEKTRQRRLEASHNTTFQQCAEEYLRLRGAKWRNGKYAAQVPSLLRRFAYPIIGSHPVREVTTADVVKMLEPIWIAKHPTATKLRGNTEAILDWATSVGHRTGDNPARLKGHLEYHLTALPKREQRHHAALPYDDVPVFLALLTAQPGLAAKMLRFTIATAARTGEAMGARWEEIDRKKATWIIPGSRMKAGKAHRVPLASAAVDVLDEIESTTGAGFIFEGDTRGKPLSSMAMLVLLKRMGRADITVHGFRASFRNWAGEQTSFPWEVCELALAHSVGDATERAYMRSDLFERRRELMQAWANFCTQIGRGVVVPLRESA